MKFCKDCKHCRPEQIVPGYAYYPAECFHPELLDMVNGGGTAPYLNRSLGGKCGEDAKLFEQKPKEKDRSIWQKLRLVKE